MSFKVPCPTPVLPAAEGFAVAGGRVTNFTSGQGLILMKEVLYVISGKRLPIVFHILIVEKYILRMLENDYI